MNVLFVSIEFLLVHNGCRRIHHLFPFRKDHFMTDTNVQTGKTQAGKTLAKTQGGKPVVTFTFDEDAFTKAHNHAMKVSTAAMKFEEEVEKSRRGHVFDVCDAVTAVMVKIYDH